jgi:hypothetical protein
MFFLDGRNGGGIVDGGIAAYPGLLLGGRVHPALSPDSCLGPLTAVNDLRNKLYTTFKQGI